MQPCWFLLRAVIKKGLLLPSKYCNEIHDNFDSLQEGAGSNRMKFKRNKCDSQIIGTSLVVIFMKKILSSQLIP